MSTTTRQEATMTTTTLAATLAAIASDPATFAAMTKDRRGGGSHVKRIRERMLTMVQGGICTKCGESDNGDEWEFCHLVPQGFFGADGATGGARGGYVDGNMTVWHKSCNRTFGERLVDVSDLARPDLVYTGSWRDIPNLPR